MKNEPTWQATAQAINALPHPVRRYLQLLEDQRDPGGNVRERMVVEQMNDELRFKLAQIETELNRLKETANVNGSRIDRS